MMRFAGYAAIFGRPDRGGDVVRAGAFAAALKRGAGAVPLLWQHEPARPIGRIEYLKEDKRGLRVIGRLSDGAAGREAAALLKEGAVTGLSFGYRVRAASGRGAARADRARAGRDQPGDAADAAQGAGARARELKDCRPAGRRLGTWVSNRSPRRIECT